MIFVHDMEMAKLLLSRIEPEKKADEGEEQQEGAGTPAAEAGTKDEGSEGMKESGQGSDSLDSDSSKTALRLRSGQATGGAPAADMAKEVAETKEIQISDAQQLATVSS